MRSPLRRRGSPLASRLEKAIACLLRARWRVLALALFVTVGSTAYSWGMPVSTSRRELVREDDPSQPSDSRFEARFGNRDNLVVVLRGGAPSRRREVARRLRSAFDADPQLKGRAHCGLSLEHAIELAGLWRPDLLGTSSEDGVIGAVDGLTSAIETGLSNDDGPTRSTVGQADENALAQLELGVRILDEQLQDDPAPIPARGLGGTAPSSVDEEGYFATADGESHLVILEPEIESDEGAELTPLIERVRAIRDSVVSAGDVTADVTGLPAFAVDELALVRRGLLASSFVSALAVALILFATMRSWIRMLLALVPLTVGVAATLALTRFVFGGLNLITSAFVSVLFGLGIDFAIYVILRYAELRRGGVAHEQSASGAVLLAGPGIVVGAMTTAVAFAALATIRFTAYAELGIIVTGGLALTLGATLVLMPVLLDVTRDLQPAQERTPPRAVVAALLQRRARPILLVSVPLIALLMAGAPRVAYNGRYFDFVPAHTESASALSVLEADPTFGPVFANTVVTTVEAARTQAEALSALPEVAAVHSPSDALPQLTPSHVAALKAGLSRARTPERAREGSAADLDRALGELGDTLDELRFALRSNGRDVSLVDRASLRLAQLSRRLASAPDGGEAWYEALDARWTAAARRARHVAREVAASSYVTADLPLALRRRFASRDSSALTLYVHPAGDIWDRATAHAFAESVATLAPDAVGPAMNADRHTRMIIEGFSQAALGALIVIAVIVFVGLKRYSDTALALLPLGVGFTCTLGAMGWARLPLDVANIVVLPLLLGIGVDAGAHVMHRYRQSEREHGAARLEDIVSGTGRALAAASATTMAGFAALLAGDYGAMQSLGATMTVGVGACLFTSGVVLPCLLVTLRRAR